MGVHIDAPPGPVFVVELAEIPQGLGGHRQRESRHDRDVDECGRGVAGAGGMPFLDLGLRQADRLLLGGQQRRGRVTADGLDTATGHDAESRLQCLGEQRVLRVGGKGGAEHHHRGRAGGDATSRELDGSGLGEVGIGEPRFRREDAQVQPFQELSAAIGVTGICLGEVDVGVDEAGEQITARVFMRFRRGELVGKRRPLTRVSDRPVTPPDHEAPSGIDTRASAAPVTAGLPVR